MLRHHRIMYFCTLVRKVPIHHQLLIRKFSATRRLVIKELNWGKPISYNRCPIIEVKLLMSIMRYVRLDHYWCAIPLNLDTMGRINFNSIPTLQFLYTNRTYGISYWVDLGIKNNALWDTIWHTLLKGKQGFATDFFKEHVLVCHTWPYIFPKHNLII